MLERLFHAVDKIISTDEYPCVCETPGAAECDWCELVFRFNDAKRNLSP